MAEGSGGRQAEESGGMIGIVISLDDGRLDNDPGKLISKIVTIYVLHAITIHIIIYRILQ